MPFRARQLSSLDRLPGALLLSQSRGFCTKSKVLLCHTDAPSHDLKVQRKQETDHSFCSVNWLEWWYRYHDANSFRMFIDISGFTVLHLMGL